MNIRTIMVRKTPAGREQTEDENATQLNKIKTDVGRLVVDPRRIRAKIPATMVSWVGSREVKPLLTALSHSGHDPTKKTHVVCDLP
jgi:hypothetical protein